MRQTRALLIRHAAPEDAARGRCYGRLDVRLSPEGLEQAGALAERLRAIALAAVYTSPSGRAEQTAAAVCAGRDLAPVPRDGLAELDFGDFEGRTYAELEAEEADFFRRWMTSPTEVRFPQGESYAQLRDRAASTLDELRVAHRDETFAVVTHGGVLRAMLATLLHLPADRAFALDVGYQRVSVVDWFDETPVVRLVNGAAADVPAQLAG